MPKLINKINYYEKDTPDKRLTKLLIILGDKMSPQEIHSNIGIVSNLIQTEYAKYEINILKAIKNCFMELPTKTFVYGTLIGLLNVARSDIGAAIVKMTSQSLQQCLNEGNWRGAKLSLKFFAELTNSNVILPRTMLDIYDDLLTTLDEPNVKMVATRLHDRSPDILEGILSKIERYFYARDRAIKEIDGLLVLNSVRPYVGSNIPYEQVDVIVPLFRIFDELDDETKNEHLEITDISYFLICDLIGDIIDIFEINRKECTKYLKDIAYSFAPGTFINKDTTHTKNSEDSTEIKIGTEDTAQKILENDTTANVSNLNKNIKCFQLEQMIVENIFSEIFRLPQPKFKYIYYHSLLTEICKNSSYLGTSFTNSEYYNSGYNTESIQEDYESDDVDDTRTISGLTISTDNSGNLSSGLYSGEEYDDDNESGSYDVFSNYGADDMDGDLPDLPSRNEHNINNGETRNENES
ncbi:5289_t:CDS:2 [Entrophospora sp. SA101]|nr:5289_t:CDS:2 [Entrophospora sp. SA101]